MWSEVDNNSKAAGLFPKTRTGRRGRELPRPHQGHGSHHRRPWPLPERDPGFSAQLSAFKGHDILVGVPIPPDFTTFWQQAGQQGYQPKVATIGKALLFPSAVEALGNAGDGLTSEVWWHPTAPFSSSLTGQTAQELADQYEADTGKQWTQPLGFAEALFEITVAAVEEAGSTEPEAITKALSTLEVSTVVGDVAWGVDDTVPPYVAKTPLVGGQWRLDDGDGGNPYELVVVSNKLAPEIPTAGTVEPLQ